MVKASCDFAVAMAAKTAAVAAINELMLFTDAAAKAKRIMKRTTVRCTPMGKK